MADLGHFSQLLEETRHFRGWRQEKVAKIVQCGEAFIPNKSETRPPNDGLKRWITPLPLEHEFLLALSTLGE